jgi:pyrroloquinoline quinone biosynthesis protein B
VGVLVEDDTGGKRLFYAPGLGELDALTTAAMQRADCVMVDGTCWRDDEMIQLGLSKKRARDMGHRALEGEHGMLALLAELPTATRRILIHINNTNPILDEDSPEHAQVLAAGIEIAHDGMDFQL